MQHVEVAMFDKMYSSAISAATTTFSVVNALHFGVLKKMGFLKEGATSFTEIHGSEETFNFRIDANENVPFHFSMESQAQIDSFLDPTNDELFLKWHFTDGSYVSLPGIAENAEITNGRVAVKQFDTLEYSFEFTGNDGTEYIYLGKKKFSIFNPIKSWSNMKGSVYEKETGKQILDSITFFGNDSISSSLMPFISSIRFG